jgi:hypothetical protein
MTNILFILQELIYGTFRQFTPALIKIDPFVLMTDDPEATQLIGWRS